MAVPSITPGLVAQRLGFQCWLAYLTVPIIPFSCVFLQLLHCPPPSMSHHLSKAHFHFSVTRRYAPAYLRNQQQFFHVLQKKYGPIFTVYINSSRYQLNQSASYTARRTFTAWEGSGRSYRGDLHLSAVVIGATLSPEIATADTTTITQPEKFAMATRRTRRR
ncbi:hypothetical protein V1522DRAFT_412818 [Lipomyces starkeyi]